MPAGQPLPGRSHGESGTVTLEDLLEPVRLYTDLIEEIRSETRDDYFIYDRARTDQIAKEIATLLDNPQIVVFAARDNDCIAGFITGEVRDCTFSLSKIGPVGYITGTYVRPAYRRKGVAARLVCMLVDFFRVWCGVRGAQRHERKPKRKRELGRTWLCNVS